MHKDQGTENREGYWMAKIKAKCLKQNANELLAACSL